MIPQARPPRAVTRSPIPPLPPGACDTHVHVFGGPQEHPRDPTRAEDPADGTSADWIRRLRGRMAALGLTRVVLVHSIVYREDMDATLEALGRLRDVARGVALVAPDVTDAALNEMHVAGIRGVRLDLVFPGPLTLADVGALAPRLASRNWHLQVFGRWASHGQEMADLAVRLPCPVVLDHAAYIPADGVDVLLRALERERLWVKASSLYRQEASAVVRAVARHRPDRLLWGSNWPHVRWDGPMPDETDLVEDFGTLLTAADAHRAFVDNPAELYGFDG